MTTAYLGFGGNLGDPEQTITLAIVMLSNNPLVHILSISSYYCSEPIDAPGKDYINAVVYIEWQSTASKLLETCLSIEKIFGRQRSTKNAPRTLDIDILIFGEKKINFDHLIIPHPNMTTRSFVLMPLLEINPDITIPGKGPAKDFLKKLKPQKICKI